MLFYYTTLIRGKKADLSKNDARDDIIKCIGNLRIFGEQDGARTDRINRRVGAGRCAG
jgi:hypothetical protein